jgi:hypothetical protein
MLAYCKKIPIDDVKRTILTDLPFPTVAVVAVRVIEDDRRACRRYSARVSPD